LKNKTHEERIGFKPARKPGQSLEKNLRDYINLKFASRGYPIVGKEADYPFLEMGRSMILNFQEKLRLLKDHRCPADQHIHNWLQDYLGEDAKAVFAQGESMLPDALILEKHGLSRLLSLPANSDKFESDILSSYRTWQGVLHNPAKDRRTSKGVFHVAEGGLPIAGDKLSVPRLTFAHMLKAAVNPPQDLMALPYTSEEENPVHTFASILLRPVVCPEVPGFTRKKTLETRFFAPGNLMANLDFVESIFGNAGDPFLPENDARLEVDHWTGHSGCVILAPHLTRLKKKDVGLPHISAATELQKKQNMCWQDEDEIYNDGGAFKITARDHKGVIVTLIADNYFGYCKKEVKTQISFSANLYGLAEEEHAGGALVFPRFDLGEDFNLSSYRREVNHTFDFVAKNYGAIMQLQSQGYGIDVNFPDIVYLPENVYIDLHAQTIQWDEQSIRLSPDHTYVMPSGYKVEMQKPSAGQRWRLVGTNAEGTFCHKPCTVSGGGKSEISKSLSDAMEEGPVIMANFEENLNQVDELLQRDYSDRYKSPKRGGAKSRPILDPERSLGSVIRLFSHSAEFTDDYNAFISTIPQTVRDFLFTLKRYWKPDWGNNWRRRFQVDSINGKPGSLLKYRHATVKTQYLRIGFEADGSWRMFGLRKDFSPATKLQREDDITASVTVPASRIDHSTIHPDVKFPAYKFTENCEFRLFQRPDDAIHRGYDKQTEIDFSSGGNFFSNYEPQSRERGRNMVADSIRFGHFSEPLKNTLEEFSEQEIDYSPQFVVSSAHPRLVEGKPSKNPRYLQTRPDLQNPRSEYLAEIGSRFFRCIPLGKPVLNPVHAVLPGRRNNPSNHKAGIRPLAVYGPVHYQELPELFMDFIASLTGKSPSTTGAGSEGALTKSPFNALLPVIDLNAALLSYIVSDFHGFTTAAGYVGPDFRVEHDVSLTVPEIWSRMFLHERDPQWLIQQGHLEKIEDFSDEDNQNVPAARLGYRITQSFVQTFFGRMFNDPSSVFTEAMLRPELQSREDYIDGIRNICETQQKVARQYFEDGSIELAIPPLKALLHIMAHGDYDGAELTDPKIRDLFDRESVLASDWYQDRLKAKLTIRKKHLSSQILSLEKFLAQPYYAEEAKRLQIHTHLEQVKERLDIVENRPQEYLDGLQGSLGADVSLAGN